MTHMDTDELGAAIDRAIGVELRAQRGYKGFSRLELGKLSGVSAKTIQRFEEGSRSPSTRQLSALCRALGMTMRDFIGKALQTLES